MFNRISVGLGLVLFFITVACSSGIGQEKYVQVMADLGCKGIVETSPKANEIYQQHSIAQKDIDKFRKGMNRDNVKEIADQIVQKVAACHGIDPKTLGVAQGQKGTS